MGAKKEANQRIGANIKAAREEFRYTQERLSELLGITPNHLSAIERGYYGASLELIYKLCHIFSIDANRLFFGKAEPSDFTVALTQKLAALPPKQGLQICKLISLLLEIMENS